MCLMVMMGQRMRARGDLSVTCSLDCLMNATRLIALASCLWGTALGGALLEAMRACQMLMVGAACTVSIWVIGMHIAERLRREIVAELLDTHIRHIS